MTELERRFINLMLVAAFSAAELHEKIDAAVEWIEQHPHARSAPDPE